MRRNPLKRENSEARDLYNRVVEQNTTIKKTEKFFSLNAPSTQTCIDIWEMATLDRNYIIAGAAIGQAVISAKKNTDFLLVIIATCVTTKEEPK